MARTRKRRPLWLRLLLMLAVSVMLFIACYGCGAANDCAPGQIDGQCGLSTAAGEFFGAVAVVAFLLVVAIYEVSRPTSSQAVAPDKDGRALPVAHLSDVETVAKMGHPE